MFHHAVRVGCLHALHLLVLGGAGAAVGGTAEINRTGRIRLLLRIQRHYRGGRRKRRQVCFMGTVTPTDTTEVGTMGIVRRVRSLVGIPSSKNALPKLSAVSEV